MSARDRILQCLRAARPSAPPHLPDLASHFGAVPAGPSLVDAADRFQRAIEAAHAEVHRVTPATVGETITAILRAKQIRRVAVGGATLADPLLMRALAAGAELVAFNKPVEQLKSTLFQETDAGFTIARSAIAETGTLVLWPGEGEPRTLSLVPPIHLVLVDAGAIHTNLYSAMQAEGWHKSMPTNVVLVSGPSKTADIQQTLAYGAHGPKEVVVLMMMSEGGAR